MEVGIRELKARLSEFVERAQRGETIYVTDRGRPKAILAPLPGRHRLDEGIAEGWIRPPNAPRPEGPRRRFRAAITVEEMLREDRGE